MFPNTESQLIEDYRRSRFDRRMALFLDHPPLRADFMEIEMEPHPDERDDAPAGRQRPFPIPGDRLTSIRRRIRNFFRIL